jgi:hypothetical protein
MSEGMGVQIFMAEWDTRYCGMVRGSHMVYLRPKLLCNFYRICIIYKCVCGSPDTIWRDTGRRTMKYEYSYFFSVPQGKHWGSNFNKLPHFSSMSFSIHHTLTILPSDVLGPTQPPIQWVLGYSRGKSDGGVMLITALHLAARLKKEYSFTCTPRLCLRSR